MKWKKALSVFVVCVLVSTLRGAGQPSAVQEVEQAVHALTQAMLSADGPMLRKLTSDALSYGHSSGKVETKAEFVETLVSGISVFEDIQLTDQTVDVIDQTAVVRHVLTAKTNDKGKGPGTVKLYVLLVWVRQGGQWSLVARQAVKAL